MSSLEDENTTFLNHVVDSNDQMLLYIDPIHVGENNENYYSNNGYVGGSVDLSDNNNNHMNQNHHHYQQQSPQQQQQQQQQNHQQQQQQQQNYQENGNVNHIQQQQQHNGLVDSTENYLSNGTALHTQSFHLSSGNASSMLQESTGTLLNTMSSQLSDIMGSGTNGYSNGSTTTTSTTTTNSTNEDENDNNNSPIANIGKMPPSPPPLPTHLLSSFSHSSFTGGGLTQQVIQQQHQNLRPITERGQEDKKKEALAFLNYYFKVVPSSKTPQTKRTMILALYTNKIDSEKRYKQPNDMANLCGAVYTFIYQHLDDQTIKEYISSSENERLSSKSDAKKRKRKRNHDITDGHDVHLQDAFLTCIKYASLLPFIEFIPIDDLQPNDYTQQHPDYLYSLDDLYKWEIELKDQKINQSKSRSIVNSMNNINQQQLQQHQLQQQIHHQLHHIDNLTTNSLNRINLPVNVTETVDSFIIYAFIPFYKPNALKITVNQMDIILEGTISLPESIQIPNGTEILVPNSSTHTCTQQDIQEGNFYKIIKLTAPIASSTVGKRDGVVVIIAKKEEGQTTIHQL